MVLAVPTPSVQFALQCQSAWEFHLMIGFIARADEEDGAITALMVDRKSSSSVQGNAFPVSR
jgi:hypothetical protein